MRNIIGILLLFAFSLSNAQNFNYQTVVRNASGDLQVNQNVGIEIRIRTGSATGSVIYTETHQITTNQHGIGTLLVGAGTTTDNFATIDWSTQNHWISTSADITGGTTYIDMGTTQLLSVPYAAYANISGGIGAFNTTSNITSNSLESYDTNDFVFGSYILGNDNSTLDDSNRFYFDKGRWAFRAGRSEGFGWDGELPYLLVGDGSVALGGSSAAARENSIGIGTTVTNFAIDGLALGFGPQTDYNANNSISIGYLTRTFGHYSVAMGDFAHTTAYGNTAIGINNIHQTGDQFNYVSTDQLFVIGNGRQPSETSNALEMLKNGNTVITGNVGIGTTIPETTYALNINGDLNYSGTLTNISDRRYKKNIKIIPNSSERLLSAEGVTYEMNHNAFPEMSFSEGKQTGVIAQDIELLFPNLVETNIDGFKSVNYLGLLPVLIETIKQQQLRIEKLQANADKIEKLEKQYALLLNLKSKNNLKDSVTSNN